MTDAFSESAWRVGESRRMIEEARTLVAIAESLRRPGPPARSDGATVASRASGAPGNAILVHAVSFDTEDDDSHALEHGQTPRPHAAPSILVLVDDESSLPDFLPQEADTDPAVPSAEDVRRAVEARVREGLSRSATERYALDVVESIRDAVIVIDRERAILHLNTSGISLLQTLTGRTGPFVGERLVQGFPPSASATLRPAIDAALSDAEASHVEDPERYRSLALDVAVFPNPYGATLLVRNITERKDMEAELIESRLRLARAESLLETARGGALT